MNNKKIIKVAAIVFGVLILFSLALHNSHGTNTPKNAQNTSKADQASGDTDAEVLRQLTAKLERVQKDNDDIKQQMVQLQTSQDSTSNKDWLKTMTNRLNESKQATDSQITGLQRDIALLQASDESDATDKKNASGISSDGMIAFVPDVAQTSILPHEKTTASQSNINNNNQTVRISNATDNTYQPNGQNVTPIYTIPAMSNLLDSTLLTALIGEVPNNGQLIQPPFPFEAIVGEKDLIAANGIDLPPQLHGMKVTGYSVGVGSFLDGLSCTRAYITKVLFVFKDGHYVVFGDDTQATTSVNPDTSLGYLTDRYGNPCMPGKYITNAPRVLSALIGVGAVAGAGSALADAQTSTYSDASNSSTAVTGNLGKYALGSGLSYGTQKGIDWMLERLKNTFDVVYIPASEHNNPKHMVINFTKTIPIDYDPHGRTLKEEDINNVTHSQYSQSNLD